MFYKNREEDVELQHRDKDGKDTEPLLSSYESFDYLLMSDAKDGAQKRKAFIQQLKRKNIFVTEVQHPHYKDSEKEFFGLRVSSQALEDYHYLLKVSDSCNACRDESEADKQTTRIRIINFIIYNTFLDTGEKLDDLLTNNVFKSVFCLHERKQQKQLTKKWASWSRLIAPQPFNDIKQYFGEKVTLYYLWLDWYTKLLVPAALLGVIVFLYGLAFFNTSPLIKEVCNSSIIMCPRCDQEKCKVWKLSETCAYAKVSHLFDNEGTVAFAVFMALWATVFLELWKRHRAIYVSRWKVYDWSELEEELIMGIVNNPNCKAKEYKHTYLQSTLVLVLVTLMLMLIIGLAQALVVFRVVAAPLLSVVQWEFIKDNASTVAVLLGAVLHYFTIQIMTRINRWVSIKLCNIEKKNTFASTERSFTIKMFTFQFFTLFSSLFYVAFFLGRINGHPGNYVRIAEWRLEECHPSGCLTDLFIQMAVIMVLKQTLNNIVEFSQPWLKSFFGKKEALKLESSCEHCNSKACCDEDGFVEPCDTCQRRDWLRNYYLASTDSFSLFNEYLEMVIQFSFTTIFVAAFPLAPLLALINNIFEIRLDAIKMVRLERRLVPRKTNDIGVWTKILEAVGVLAVIANGLVIGITSDFIPRMVYRYRYGPCANGITDTHCMEGYINDTLSTAFMGDPEVQKDFKASQLILNSGVNVTHCSYRDYRNHEDYSLTSQFWLVLAVRFAFVILFEHVLVVCKFIVAWFVPDTPTQVKNHSLRDKMERLKKEFQEMKLNRSTDV
ncbi:anoctamin-9-like [Betta splendens]|uniref:Anoctamin n=1 Tax=Betta splendens TaxID=158456 RepID=A0A6P7M2G8_BETSP|nr:anoctamin-9-like [Betta splendens]